MTSTEMSQLLLWMKGLFLLVKLMGNYPQFMSGMVIVLFRKRYLNTPSLRFVVRSRMTRTTRSSTRETRPGTSTLSTRRVRWSPPTRFHQGKERFWSSPTGASIPFMLIQLWDQQASRMPPQTSKREISQHHLLTTHSMGMELFTQERDQVTML